MAYSSYHKRAISSRELHPETQMMSYGYDPFLSEGAVKPPVFLTSTFAFRTAEDGAEFFDVVAGRKPAPADSGAGLVYSRFNHPNLEIVEDRLALLDDAEDAIVTSSGMAAIGTVLLTFLRPGDQVVHSTPLYGGTETLLRKILPEWGIGGHPLVSGLSATEMETALERAAARGRVGLFYVETPANPTNSLIDLQAVVASIDRFEQKHGYRPISACDNTMLGPIFQHPIREGIDLSIYSLTKYVGGHSDLVAGGVTGRRDLIARLRLLRSAFGSQLDPHSSWMIARSMETLVLRMRRAAATGSRVAHWLAGKFDPAGAGPAPAADHRRELSARLPTPVHWRGLDVLVRARGRSSDVAFRFHQRTDVVQVRGKPGRHRVADLSSGLDDSFRRSDRGA